MSISRRDFTLLGLVGALGLASSAGAGEPQKKQAPPPFEAKFTARRSGGLLFVDLSIENVSDEGRDVLVRVGSRPAPTLAAAIQGSERNLDLPALEWDGDDADLRTRAGPRPVYEPVAARHTVKIGTYRFGLPAGLADDERLELELVATVRSGSEYLKLAPVSLTIGDGEA